jgi:hypothetical protein
MTRSDLTLLPLLVLASGPARAADAPLRLWRSRTVSLETRAGESDRLDGALAGRGPGYDRPVRP